MASPWSENTGDGIAKLSPMCSESKGKRKEKLKVKNVIFVGFLSYLGEKKKKGRKKTELVMWLKKLSLM